MSGVSIFRRFPVGRRLWRAMAMENQRNNVRCRCNPDDDQDFATAGHGETIPFIVGSFFQGSASRLGALPTSLILPNGVSSSPIAHIADELPGPRVAADERLALTTRATSTQALSPVARMAQRKATPQALRDRTEIAALRTAFQPGVLRRWFSGVHRGS